MRDWGRLITAMVTPFDDNMNMDLERAARLAKHLVEKGSTALVVNGTTGESPTVKEEEKLELLEAVRNAVEVPIIAGIGSYSTESTIRNAAATGKLDVDGLMVVTPYYNKPDQESLFNHYTAIAKSTPLNILLYNVPGRTGCNLLPETVKRLAEIPNIVALKEASGDLVQFSRAVRDTPHSFRVYSGEDALTLPSLAVGGYGVVSVTSHVAGLLIKEMMESYFRGDGAAAARIHLQLLDLNDAMFSQPNPMPVKTALRIAGLDVGGLRMPLRRADAHVEKTLERCMGELGLLP